VAGEPARAYLTERGLSEEVCRDFRLGLSPGGDRLAAKAREKGYSQDELLAAGLVNRRGNDYYAGRLVFPLSNARGRVLGFGARRLHDDDPINAWFQVRSDGRSVRAVLDDVDLSYERLARAIAALPEDLVTRRDAFPWMEGESLAETDLFGHLHDEHMPSIRAWIATRP